MYNEREELPIWHRKRAYGCEFLVNADRSSQFTELLGDVDGLKATFAHISMTSGEVNQAPGP